MVYVYFWKWRVTDLKKGWATCINNMKHSMFYIRFLPNTISKAWKWKGDDALAMCLLRAALFWERSILHSAECLCKLLNFAISPSPCVSVFQWYKSGLDPPFWLYWPALCHLTCPSEDPPFCLYPHELCQILSSPVALSSCICCCLPSLLITPHTSSMTHIIFNTLTNLIGAICSSLTIKLIKNDTIFKTIIKLNVLRF